MTFDAEKYLLYVSGGNVAPYFYGVGLPGATLDTSAVLAFDAPTRRLVWYRQFIPHDVHDYDVTHVVPIFKTEINGSTRNVAASTRKDGMLRLTDRDSK